MASRTLFLPVVQVATAGIVLGAAVSAQSVQVQGVINGRSQNKMALQTTSGNVTVVLSEATQVDEVDGVLHARRRPMAVTALVPGLAVQVQGTYNGQNQLVAETVKFNGKDLKTAMDIQAGVTQTQQQEQAQQQQIAQQQAQIQAQQAQLQQEQQAQAAQAAKVAAEQAAIAANKAAIAAVNKRFGEMADYIIWDEVAVLFGNGKVNVEPEYQSKLLELARKAKTITGYVIEVKGYASAVGSAALNEKLSRERAANVTEFLEQRGSIPLTSILAPGAMGTSQQVAPNTTAEGQAENRRVVVRVLQSKAIAGT